MLPYGSSQLHCQAVDFVKFMKPWRVLECNWLLINLYLQYKKNFYERGDLPHALFLPLWL
jgi:hypothetical protein